MKLIKNNNIGLICFYNFHFSQFNSFLESMRIYHLITRLLSFDTKALPFTSLSIFNN